MQAIILAGGFGTRLQSAVSDVPKPMAPICGRPFLEYLLESLQLQGVNHVVLSVHHMWQKIEAAFGKSFRGMRIDYAVEESPLLTGGAMVNSFDEINRELPVFVLNGDTFAGVNYCEMRRQCEQGQHKFAMAVRHVPDTGRYGQIHADNGCIVEIHERGAGGPGYINAGVYFLTPGFIELLSGFPKRAFSFETDFLRAYVREGKPCAYVANGPFIDIGVPADYARAQTELPGMIASASTQ